MTPLTMAQDNTVEAHSSKDTAQDPGLEVVEEVEHHQQDSNEADYSYKRIQHCFNSYDDKTKS